VSRNSAPAAPAPNTAISYTEKGARITKCKLEMHENRNLFLFLIEINNMHHTRHILPIPSTCIWRQCSRCGVSWHRSVPVQLIAWEDSFPNDLYCVKRALNSAHLLAVGSGHIIENSCRRVSNGNGFVLYVGYLTFKLHLFCCW